MRSVTVCAASVILAAAVCASAQQSSIASTYPPSTDNDARQAVADALIKAKANGKHVLLNFGASWCLECRILEKTFAEPDVAAFLEANFVVVPVPVGQAVGINYSPRNTALVQKYEVFTTRENAGIPYIVILDPTGRVVAKTEGGEWRQTTAVAADNVMKDLRRWAPKQVR